MIFRTPSRRRTLLIMATTLAVVLAACGNADDVEVTDDTTTTAPVITTTIDPDTTTTTEDLPGDQITVFGLEPGECFDERVVAGQGQVEVEELFRLPCGDPHQNEVYLVATMAQGNGEEYPGEDAIRGFADTNCLEAFEEFIGLQYELSDFEVAYLMPTESSWPRPDRRVVCFAFDRSGEPVEGTAAGAAR